MSEGICPLMTRVVRQVDSVHPTQEVPIKCYGEGCAWYADKRCVIQLIARILSDMKPR